MTPSGAPDARVVGALACVQGGDLLGGLAGWRTAEERPSSTPLFRAARLFFERVRGRPGRGPIRAPPPPPEPESPAWERAWAGDLDEARRLAQASPGGASLGVLGAVLALERRSREAIAVLDRVLASGAREDLVLHRARALVHLGDIDAATKALAALGDGESFARRAMIARAQAARPARPGAFGAWARRVAASDVHLNGFFARELPAVVGPAAADRALRSPADLVAVLEDLLDRMAGNLGPSPTLADIGPGGRRRFVRVDVPPSSRAACARALHGLPDAGLDATAASLERLVRRFPRSPHPRCYEGELLLWLGRYDAAWRSFVAARSVEPARWADIGMVAVLTLTGRTTRARVAASYAERHSPPVRGGTLPVYRGALRRALGDQDGAIEDLGTAVQDKPSRVGARIELALALRAAGRAREADEHVERALREAAPILVSAADSLGAAWHDDRSVLGSDRVLVEAVRAMRGNRSSAVVTWGDAGGELRVLTHPGALRHEARKLLSAGPFDLSRPRSMG